MACNVVLVFENQFIKRYMNKKIVVTCLSVLLASLSYAQDEVSIVDDSVQADAFDMPEGMLISEEELMNEASNINTLSEGTGTSRVLSYDDSVLVSRLSRIPTTIEMPLNDVTRKFIDTYSTRMKGSVAIMLGSANSIILFLKRLWNVMDCHWSSDTCP